MDHAFEALFLRPMERVLLNIFKVKLEEYFISKGIKPRGDGNAEMRLHRPTLILLNGGADLRG